MNRARNAGMVVERCAAGEGPATDVRAMEDRGAGAAPSCLMPPVPTSPASQAQLLERGSFILRAAGIDNPRREARLLLAHALEISMPDLVRDPDRLADPAPYETVLARRAAREPLAYILGAREFWSLKFAVSPATLIPRPESETLIETALALFADRAPPRRILDLGTGSGCLLLTVLHEFPQAFGIGTDRSFPAARLAATNAALLGLADRAAVLCADWSTPLRGHFDLILCNPPYIPTSEVSGLMPEVARYEPVAALDGGPDGLVAYRQIIVTLRCLLRRDGVAILELGAGQDAGVARLAVDCDLVATTRPDLAGIPRAMVLTRKTV